MSLDPTRASQLRAEIIRFKENRQRENKKLAKEIVKWIDTAMTINEASAANLQDIEIAEESEEG
jgi:hypothetical protein